MTLRVPAQRPAHLDAAFPGLGFRIPESLNVAHYPRCGPAEIRCPPHHLSQITHDFLPSASRILRTISLRFSGSMLSTLMFPSISTVGVC